MNTKEIQNNELTRRDVLTGATKVAGATLFGLVINQVLAEADQEGTMTAPANVQAKTESGGTKPVYVPAEGTKDPAAIAHADILFWSDILSEHGMFFAMLMPGKELAQQRAQAEKFQAAFGQHFKKAQGTKLDKANLASFANETITAVKPFIDFKHRMHEAQVKGTIHSLVWPLFFEHTAHEAERFIKRLDMLAKGNSEYERVEVVGFWTEIMGEHADFVAHLLDPQEEKLHAQAMKTADDFKKLKAQPPASTDPVMAAANAIHDFKVTAEKGIAAGQIKSIIHPALADHVRREAVKFIDELKRTQV
jgi:Domain of unknown function (DUF2935)